jgi:hypothetical protein
MILISEHRDNGVSAKVYRRPHLNDWVTVCLDENDMERFGYPCKSLDTAEDTAEDWVLRA